MAMADSMAAVSSIAIQGMASPPDYAENGEDAVATYTVTVADAAGAVWSLTGDDAAEFMVTDGMLSFTTPPDYENPVGYGRGQHLHGDGGGDLSSDATVSDMLEVTVTVTNVDEPGMVTLWASPTDPLTMAPQVGKTITGLVVDPDGGVTGQMWQWSRTMDTADMNSWKDITDATNDAYMVMADDEGYYLRVMATYTDAVGTAMVDSEPTMMVAAEAVEMTLLERYDANPKNGKIDRLEVLDAIRDFLFNETIERDDVVDVIRLFIFRAGSR